VRSRLRRLAPALLLATAALLPRPAPAAEVRVSPPSPRPGDVAVVSVSGAEGNGPADGTFLGRPLRFFPREAGGFEALVGVDLETRPGKATWRALPAPSGRSTRDRKSVV